MVELNRYLRHPPAATAAPDGWLASDRPLGAGRVQMLMASNASHLLTENATRVLAVHPGIRGIYRQSLLGGSFTDPPQAQHINWWYGPLSGGIALCLGTHYAWKIPGTTRFPRLVLRAKWWVGSNAPYLAASLFVCPGRGTPQWQTGPVSTTPINATTATDLALGVNLTDGDLERIDVAPRASGSGTPSDDVGSLYRFTVFLGGYCTSGVDAAADHGHILGISLCLEEPT